MSRFALVKKTWDIEIEKLSYRRQDALIQQKMQNIALAEEAKQKYDKKRKVGIKFCGSNAVDRPSDRVHNVAPEEWVSVSKLIKDINPPGDYRNNAISMYKVMASNVLPGDKFVPRSGNQRVSWHVKKEVAEAFIMFFHINNYFSAARMAVDFLERKKNV